MLSLEAAQSQVRESDESYRRAEELWTRLQEDLAGQMQRTRAALATLDERRAGSVSRIDPREIRLYDSLRSSKGGQAVVKVERGLCRGCRMALPTHQLQRARLGREPVLCNSCGRILFVN